MKHLDEDQLVLHRYGEETGRGAEAPAHLESCGECRERYAALCRDLEALDMEVPEPAPGYESALWRRLEPRLGEGPGLRLSRVAPRRARWPGWLALAASLIGAFLLGRHSPHAPALPAEGLAGPVRERILLMAVGDHLERSQMVLVELANASSTESLDVTSERHLADHLVGENRLYRQTAVRAGETGVADVLEELERVLVEIAHSPDSLPAAELRQIQHRIEAKGLLFRVRVVGSQVRERERQSARTLPGTSS